MEAKVTKAVSDIKDLASESATATLKSPVKLTTPSESVTPPAAMLAARRSQQALPLRQLWSVLYEEERDAIRKVALKQARPLPIYQLMPSNPTRPPDWRWQGALHWLLEGLPNWNFKHEKWLRSGVRLLIGVGLNWIEPPSFVGIEPWVAGMYQTLRGPKSEDIRVALESLILADLPRCEIAREMALPECAIDWYEAYFFDVRSRLTATSTVVHEFIGTPAKNESLLKTMGRERRRLAYFGGPFVAHELNQPVIDLPKPKTAEEAQAFLKADARRHVERMGHLVIRSLSVDDPQQAKQLLRVWERIQTAEMRRKNEHASLNPWGQSAPLSVEESRRAVELFKKHLTVTLPRIGAIVPKAPQKTS